MEGLKKLHRIPIFFLQENGIEEFGGSLKVSDNRSARIVFILVLSIHKFDYYVLRTKFSKDPYQHLHKSHIF